MRVKEGFGKITTKAERMGKRTQSSLGGMKAALGGVIALGAAATKAFSLAEQAAGGASLKLVEVAGGIKSLVQISDTLGDLQSRKKLNQFLQTSAGFGRSEAQDFSFDLASLGASREGIKLLGGLRNVEASPRQLALSALKLRKQFKEELGGHAIVDLAGKLLVAGEASPVSAAGLGVLSSNALGLGKALGFKPSTILAAVAKGAGVSPTPEQGATQIEGLFGAFLKDPERRFEGIGLLAALEKVNAFGDDERRKLIGGRKEARLGLALLNSQLPEIKALSGKIRIADRGVVDAKRFLAAQDPELSAVLASEKASERLSIARRRSGVGEKISDTQLSTALAISEERGDSVISRAGIHAVGAGLDLFNAPPDVTAGILGAFMSDSPSNARALTEKILSAAAAPIAASIDRELERRNALNKESIENKESILAKPAADLAMATASLLDFVRLFGALNGGGAAMVPIGEDR